MATSITGQGIAAYKAPDDALSSESKNAVQNKVIDEELSDVKKYNRNEERSVNLMESEKNHKQTVSFSLNEVSKPKFNSSQIRVDGHVRATEAGLPKPSHKLVVGRSGKVVYSK